MGIVTRLAEAIGYPERVPADATSTTLQVDGMEIDAVDTGRALRLALRLTDDETLLPRLAEYATGRMLKEDATLSCDGGVAFLWQEFGGNVDQASLKTFFEMFVSSCDWWLARIEAGAGGGESHLSPEMMIRP